MWHSVHVVFAKENKTAAAGKTSTKLIHVTKSQERQFCQNRNACRSREDLNKANTCNTNLRNVILAEKKEPAAAGKTSTGPIPVIIPGFPF